MFCEICGSHSTVGHAGASEWVWVCPHGCEADTLVALQPGTVLERMNQWGFGGGSAAT